MLNKLKEECIESIKDLHVITRRMLQDRNWSESTVIWLLAAGDWQLLAARGCLAARGRPWGAAAIGRQRANRSHSLLTRGTGQHVTAAMAAAR